MVDSSYFPTFILSHVVDFVVIVVTLLVTVMSVIEVVIGSVVRDGIVIRKNSGRRIIYKKCGIKYFMGLRDIL